MNIPGLLYCSLEHVEGKGVDLESFDGAVFHIPEAHRYGKVRPMHNFEKIRIISNGTFGIIHECRDVRNKKHVMLKEYLNDPADDLSSGILQEISVLNTLKHQNLIHLVEVAAGENIDSFYLVMENCRFSLHELIEQNAESFFEPATIKNIIMQMCQGLDFIHSGLLIHRNINPQNIYFHETGLLKIAEFQNSCLETADGRSANIIAPSACYASPELLLSFDTYTTKVDMWSVGCIFGELLQKELLFPGLSTVEVLENIISTVGAPNEMLWPGFSRCAKVIEFNGTNYCLLSAKFQKETSSCINLLKCLISYPKGRCTAKQCLDHVYFTEDPLPLPVEEISLLLDYANKEFSYSKTVEVA